MMPKMFLVRQRVEHPVIADAGQEAARVMRECDVGRTVKAGDRVAIAAGSRGIAQIDRIAAAVVAHFKSLGAKPFIFPAMGCHGGGNSAKQKATLEWLGITEANVGCPVLSEIEPVQIGHTADGVPVYLDVNARQAEHLMVMNRVKPHSDFFGTIGSGLLKMLAIGCGKMRGADTTHEAAITYGLEHMLRSVSSEVLRAAPVLGGLGVIEGPTGRTDTITWVPAAEMTAKEPELFSRACRLAPAIPLPRANLLVIDSMGKNISGCGMDPFVIGRQEYLNVHASYTDFRADRVYVRDLTDQSLGNGDGVGMADATTQRLVSKLDYATIRIGVLTSRTLALGRIPIAFENDLEALDALLGSTTAPRDRATLIRIKNTTDLEFLEISENLLPAWESLNRGSVLSGPYELAFGANRDLIPLPIPAEGRSRV